VQISMVAAIKSQGSQFDRKNLKKGGQAVRARVYLVINWNLDNLEKDFKAVRVFASGYEFCTARRGASGSYKASGKLHAKRRDG